MSPARPKPDESIRKDFTVSAALLTAADTRAAALGLTRSGYLDQLMRRDLEAAGVPVPPPLAPKHNGPRHGGPKKRPKGA